MAFTDTKVGSSIFGNKAVAWGTYASTNSDTGGDIDTGLHKVDAMFFSGSGAAVNADMPAINETLPCTGSAVTIVTTADATGFWFAIGDF